MLTEKRNISFVLPVALREPGLPIDRSTCWRKCPDEATLARTQYLIDFFLSFFNQKDLCEFLIICPNRDMSELSGLIRATTRDPRYAVISELDVCDVTQAVDVNTGNVSGWRAQQILKLAIAEHIRSEYYVTLDYDVLCIRSFSYDNLVRHGHAITNVETVNDYKKIYTDRAATREVVVKTRRYHSSAQLLGYERSPFIRHFYGETPAVMHTESVKAMATCLNKRFHDKWTDTLARQIGWTEYSLYYQFLEMTNQLSTVCLLAGCNDILDLERSVWRASTDYRGDRVYDSRHFFGEPNELPDARGLFVAIQSWLSASAWLPHDCESISEFYELINRWRRAITQNPKTVLAGTGDIVGG